MSGEKLKNLERGRVPDVVQEEKPQTPPKFLYEVHEFSELLFFHNYFLASRMSFGAFCRLHQLRLKNQKPFTSRPESNQKTTRSLELNGTEMVNCCHPEADIRLFSTLASFRWIFRTSTPKIRVNMYVVL